MSGLRSMNTIFNVAAKLPLGLGNPFKVAARSIAGTMAAIEQDVRDRTRQIQADIDAIHGKDVAVHFTGSAGGNVTFQTTGGTPDFPVVKGSLRFAAAGGMINGAFVEVLATGVPTTLSGHGPIRVDVGNAGSLGGITIE